MIITSLGTGHYLSPLGGGGEVEEGFGAKRGEI